MATDTLPHASIIGAVVPRIDGPLKTTGTARYAVRSQRSGPRTRGAGAGHHRQGNNSQPRHFRGRKDAGRAPGPAPRQSGGCLPHHSRTKKTAPWPSRVLRLTTTRSIYWGQFVAAVVAETLEQASAGAQAVRVEYDAEPPDVQPDLGEGFTGEPKRAGNAAIPTRLFPPRR